MGSVPRRAKRLESVISICLLAVLILTGVGVFVKQSEYDMSRFGIGTAALPDAPYISEIMRYLMYYNSYGEWQEARELFAQLPSGIRNRLLSTDYGLAEARCPQHYRKIRRAH